jgi:hypothetical protein
LPDDLRGGDHWCGRTTAGLGIYSPALVIRA